VSPTRPAPRLVRYGLTDADRAARLLGPTGFGLWDPDVNAPTDDAAAVVLAALSAVADPDLALRALDRIADAVEDRDDLVAGLCGDPVLRDRLLPVLGASAAFGDHLVAHPADWHSLGQTTADPPDGAQVRRELLAAVGASPADGVPGGMRAAGGGPDVAAELRTEYRRHIIRLAATDLNGALDVDAVTGALADLADATLAAALAMAAADLPPDVTPARLAVIAMGKCGGRELNYVSDVDVIFVAEPDDGHESTPTVEAALRTATQLATGMMRVCAEVAWPVDAALRPEGKDGPLVRTLSGYQTYYRRWAHTWEFQALLKARPAAGDLELGREWQDAVAPMIWHAADREGVVEEVRGMRRRVTAALPAKDASREVKLGPGGLRDIEFAVQLLQLVHGRGDASLRSPNTLVALDALTAGGYVGRADGEALAGSYRFLRIVEHRLQLQRLRRTHKVPADQTALRWLARACGFAPGARGDAADQFTVAWQQHVRDVRRLHEKLFYRPLLEAVARVPGEALRLTPQAARQRLEVLGFADPAGALRHLEALSVGVSRRALIQRALLPALLPAFADAPDPDGGLLAYRKVSEHLGRTPWYLRFLRDEGLVATRLARLLGTSRYVADLLARDPVALQMLADDAELTPRPADALRETLRAAAERNPDPAAAVAAIRALRRRELLRIASADLLGLLPVEAVGTALAAVTDAVLAAALDVATRAVADAQGMAELPMRLAVIAVGRLGGEEVGYSSDADVLFVHEPVDPGREAEATALATAVAEELRRLLSAPAPDPPLGVDASLRPEGKQGPLVRSLGSYRAYYQRWADVWEAQALLRARPVAGDPELCGRFVTVADAVRYPDGGLAPEQVTEIRRIKARVDNERLPRGADPATHTKLGRGGLADVEWTVQLLQLRHAWSQEGLRTPRTLEALAAAREAGLVTPVDAAALAEAWRLATRVRNAVMLVRGRPSDQLPRRGRELTGVVRAMGRPVGADPGEFVDEYLRTARRARRAVERVFHG
jgi:glutamate-ammonia-ligase adenylyltransferase